MKEMKAIIQPLMLVGVCAVLRDPGMTVSQVMGWGKAKAVTRELSYDCRWWRTALACLAVTLSACATALPPPQSVLGRLTVTSITVVPTNLGDAAAGGREWFQKLLVGHATATARRMSVEARLAERVEPGPESHQTHVLSGSVSMPIALAPEYRGSHATFQKGPLAAVRLELRDPTGALVGAVEATVRWKDVRWTVGGPKTRRARRPDAALIDAVELATERAVKRLTSEL